MQSSQSRAGEPHYQPLAADAHHLLAQPHGGVAVEQRRVRRGIAQLRERLELRGQLAEEPSGVVLQRGSGARASRPRRAAGG
jgi:hypothetical protein